MDHGVAVVGALAIFVEGRAVAEIGAGAKGLALRRQHHGAAFDILVERFERAGDFLDQRDVEEIIRRTADFDQRDMAGFFDRDILERAHRNSFSNLLGGGARRFRLALDDQRVDDGEAFALAHAR